MVIYSSWLLVTKIPTRQPDLNLYVITLTKEGEKEESLSLLPNSGSGSHPETVVSNYLISPSKCKLLTCLADIFSFSPCRYNISTDDYHPWLTNASYNDNM